MALLMATASAMAQETNWVGTQQNNAAETVEVKATPPIMMSPRKFRIMLRLTSNIDDPVSYAALHNSRVAIGWRAFSERGAMCGLRDSGTSGIPFYSYRVGPNIAYNLDEYDGSHVTAGINRPAMVVANFDCDMPISRGEEITIQIQFWYRLNGRWEQSDYVFEKSKIQ